MAKLTLRDIRKSFNKTEVLHGIDLDVAEGEFVAFVGPSGCGKSTLLRLICGLDDVTAGTIAIDDEIVSDVPPARRGIAMVFQSYALYPHMTVAQNMGYALRLAGTDKAEIEKRVSKAAEILRLAPLLDRKPRQLSGGQRQRVAIGRAIVREPRIFLFDEPLSNLDASLRVDMRTEIARLKARLGTTMIYVTHDQTEAMTLADKIVVLNGGRVEQIGRPLDLYREPANRFVATFIGSPRMNLIPGSVLEDGQIELPGHARLPLRLQVRPGSAIEVGVRAEHLSIDDAADSSTLRGDVALVEHLGADVYAHVAVPGIEQSVIVRLEGDAVVRAGSTVALMIDPSRVHAFNSSGHRIPTQYSVRSVA